MVIYFQQRWGQTRQSPVRETNKGRPTRSHGNAPWTVRGNQVAPAHMVPHWENKRYINEQEHLKIERDNTETISPFSTVQYHLSSLNSNTTLLIITRGARESKILDQALN